MTSLQLESARTSSVPAEEPSHDYTHTTYNRLRRSFGRGGSGTTTEFHLEEDIHESANAGLQVSCSRWHAVEQYGRTKLGRKEYTRQFSVDRLEDLTGDAQPRLLERAADPKLPPSTSAMLCWSEVRAAFSNGAKDQVLLFLHCPSTRHRSQHLFEWSHSSIHGSHDATTH